MQENESTVRIKSIKVMGLFGLYDHHVVLKEDRVTVVHGPNGVGKTVLLKLTHAFLEKRYIEMLGVPFQLFEMRFDNGSVVNVARNDGTAEGSSSLVFEFHEKSGLIEPNTMTAEQLRSVIQNRAENVPFLRQIGSDEWLDKRTDEVLSIDEVALFPESCFLECGWVCLS